VVLMRPGEAGIEVLLGRRPATMAFAAGMHVFPGGRVDPGDADPRLVARSIVTPAEAASRLGGDIEPEAAVAAWIAAIRESFEEAGVLLADIGYSGTSDAGGMSVADARRALLAGTTTFADMAEALGLTLRTDRLVPLSRWVTPPGYARRFDARFFVAALPDDAEATLEGDEVTAQTWITPRAALDAMAAGAMGLWLPTSSTLQQLEHVRHVLDVRERLAPGRLGPVVVDTPAPDVVRIGMPAGGGIAGQPINAYLVGRRRFVVVDPGDPTGPALDRCVAEAAARDGEIVAVVLTHADPDHAAGAEALVERLGTPVHVGPGGGHDLPYDVLEMTDGQTIELGDVPLRAIATPGPRRDHVALLVGEGSALITGDLEGRRGARSIPGPPDNAAWDRSRARIDELAGGATRLPVSYTHLTLPTKA
jgi:glyoxylase-like metal-dependent hydrolase (beta-lactamase superfamily II)/8-oxo-dGTP pyrophosphatase MutT (NUDIX family)